MMSEAELVHLAARVMEQRGHAVVRHGNWLEHRDSGIGIWPVLEHAGPAPSGVRTVCIVMTHHPRFRPDGVFEFQHAVAATVADAVRDGFDQWLQLDLVPLLDALRSKLEHCSALEFNFPRPGGGEFVRRVVLGPIGHIVADPQSGTDDVEHPFCPCCLLTNTFDAFRQFLQADEFFGIRLLASRNENGAPQADCRINGRDWEAGKRALCRYAETWPQQGFEMRKQYVVLHTLRS